MLFTRRAGQVRVESVLPNSPSDHAGLRGGDVVLSVDDRDIAGWDLPQLTQLLDDGEPGRKVSVRTMQRLGEQWRPWRSVATWYLWRSLDPVPVEY